jgi:gluconokinase
VGIGRKLGAISVLVMPAAELVVVLMGPAGCGKSTIGRALAERLDWPFVDADELHPPENVAAMRAGIALTDHERRPWLAAVARQIAAWTGNAGGGVIACSALKRAYRQRLAQAGARTVFVLPQVPREILIQRVAARPGHYMPASLVASQLATLENPADDEGAIGVDGTMPLADTVAAIVAVLMSRFDVVRGHGT